MKTCKDCIFKCKSANSETCERFKDSALFSIKKTFKVFLSSSIEVLTNEKFIGEADSWEEACELLIETVPEAAKSKYWRYVMGDIATFIDYGSWSQFCAIVPPLQVEDFFKKGDKK